jgi:UDP-N-acetylglucosamine 1-carboxyvinyltransferase
MEKFVIEGGNVLKGTVTVSGAKNSALKVLCASILTPEEVRLFNMPTKLEDVKVQIDMLKSIGANVTAESDMVVIDCSSAREYEVFMDKEKGIRTSLLMLGSMLGIFGRARVPLPSGDNIGERKYDLHIYALERLGARVKLTDDGFLEAECNGLRGAEIEFPFLTMGGTENTIIASCLAKGRTIIRNAYITPEVLDLIKFLNGMGAKIKVRGSRFVQIDGVEELYGTNHKIIPDRLEALTFIVAGAVTKGFLEIKFLSWYNFGYATFICSICNSSIWNF